MAVIVSQVQEIGLDADWKHSLLIEFNNSIGWVLICIGCSRSRDNVLIYCLSAFNSSLNIKEFSMSVPKEGSSNNILESVYQGLVSS